MQILRYVSACSVGRKTYYPNCTVCSVCRLAAALGAAVELSPQRIHDSFLLVPGVVTTELLDLRGGEVVEAKGIHPLLGPLRYNSNDQVTMVKIENFVVPIFYCITQDVSRVLAQYKNLHFHFFSEMGQTDSCFKSNLTV